MRSNCCASNLANYSMTTQQDFEELLRLLEKHKVDYMIVGGYAVAFHGYPRFTKDIDLFYDVSTDNLERLRCALMEFGFQPAQLATETFTNAGGVVTFGVAPVRRIGDHQLKWYSGSVVREDLMADEVGRITINPEQCGGRPCIRGMRIRVVDITPALLYASRRLDRPVIAA